MTKITSWTRPVVFSQIRNAPGDVQIADVLHRHHHILVLNITESLHDHLLKSIKILFSQDCQTHDVTAVPIAMKLQQTIPDTDSLLLWNGVQCLFISSSKFVEIVIRIGSGLLNLVNSPGITWNVLLMFRINCINFSISCRFCEQRRQEKLTKSIKSPI